MFSLNKTWVLLLRRVIQLILFVFPWAFSEGVTFHHPFLKESLFYLLTPCVFLSAFHQQTQEYHAGSPKFYRHPLWLCFLVYFFWNLLILEADGKILAVAPLLNVFCALVLVQGFSRLWTQKEFLVSCLRAFVWGAVLASGLFLLSFVWNHLYFSGQPAHGYERPFYNPNALTLFLLCPCFFSQTSYFSSVSKIKQSVLLLFLFAFICGESEGAWIGLCCGTIAWILFHATSILKIKKNILGVLVLASLIASFVLLPLFLKKSDSPTVAIRQEIYQGTLALWKSTTSENIENPSISFFQLPEAFGAMKQWTGHGAGGFRSHYGNFRTLRYSLLDLSAPNTTSPHNFQWEILIDSGLIGLALFYGVLWFFFRYAQTVLTQQFLPETRFLAGACVAGMVALLVDGLTSHFFFSVLNWFTLSFVISLISALYYEANIFRSPYPHYLLGVPSKKQKALDQYFFFFLTLWSLIFIREFVYKPFQAEMQLKQASRKEKKSPEIRADILASVLKLSYETEARRMARVYLIEVYYELWRKHNDLAFLKEAVNLALFQEKLYPKTGNTLLAIAMGKWSLMKDSISPESHWFRYLKEHVLAFPFSQESSDWVTSVLANIKPHERLLLRDFCVSLFPALKQIYEEAEAANDLATREKNYAKKMKVLSYQLYLYALSDEKNHPLFWIENALRWDPQNLSFRILLARSYFYQNQLTKAREFLKPMTPSQIEFQAKSLNSSKNQEFLKFLRQYWETSLPEESQ